MNERCKPLEFTLSPEEMSRSPKGYSETGKEPSDDLPSPTRIFFFEPVNANGGNSPRLEIRATSPSFFRNSEEGITINGVTISGFVPLYLETTYRNLIKASIDNSKIDRDVMYHLARAILYRKELTFGEDEVVANWGTRPYLPINDPTQQRMSNANDNAFAIEAFFLQNLGTVLEIIKYLAKARNLYREYATKIEEAQKLSNGLAAIGGDFSKINGKLKFRFRKPKGLNFIKHAIDDVVSCELQPAQHRLIALRDAFPRGLMEYVSPTFYPRSF